MRTPNTECCICKKPLYRRPFELKMVRYVACMEHRNEAQLMYGITDAQLSGLALGRKKGTNNLTGIPKSQESKHKRSVAMKAWCAANPGKVAARGEKTRGHLNTNWKGGTSRLNTAIRLLPQHRKWMNTIKERDGECVHCGSKYNLEAHHIKAMSEIIDSFEIIDVEGARECEALWDISNGESLCDKCHCKIHGRLYTPPQQGRRYMPPKKRRSMAGAANPNYRGGNVSVSCPQCGTDFQVKPSEVKKRKHCSRRCASESQRRKV